MSEGSAVACGACVIRLMRKCYAGCWWFPLLREPLVAGMRFLGRVNGLTAERYAPNHPECRGCLRFLKADLEKKSGAFRLLNRFIGPWFRKLRDARLSQADLEAAKEYAREMMLLMETHDQSGNLDR